MEDICSKSEDKKHRKITIKDYKTGKRKLKCIHCGHEDGHEAALEVQIENLEKVVEYFQNKYANLRIICNQVCDLNEEIRDNYMIRGSEGYKSLERCIKLCNMGRR